MSLTKSSFFNKKDRKGWKRTLCKIICKWWFANWLIPILFDATSFVKLAEMQFVCNHSSTRRWAVQNNDGWKNLKKKYQNSDIFLFLLKECENLTSSSCEDEMTETGEVRPPQSSRSLKSLFVWSHSILLLKVVVSKLTNPLYSSTSLCTIFLGFLDDILDLKLTSYILI